VLSPILRLLLEPASEAFVKFVEEDSEAIVFSDLTTVEQGLRLFTQELGRLLLQAFSDTRLAQVKRHESRRRCRHGHRMELNRNTCWERQTLFGPISISDIYTYCRRCAESARPLHAFLGTDVERWSLVAQEVAVDLCADESCEKASDKLNRLFPGVSLDRSTARHFLNKHGKRARKFVTEKLRRAAGEANKESCALEIEVEMDGGMVPVATLSEIVPEPGQQPELTPVRGLPKRKKDCRWEEVRVGVVQIPKGPRLFTVRPNFELDEVFADLYALGRIEGLVDDHTRVRGIADGAPYIRKRLEETFDCSPFKFILDRPHAKEHLSEAGKALGLGEQTQAWAGEALKKLEAGLVDEVVQELREAHERTANDELRKAANYFERNGDAVSYADYREAGWSTASSEVESAHRHVVQVRLKISGAWWDPENVPNILSLRMLKANGWWDEYWDHQRAIWQDRAATLRSEARQAA